MNHFWFTYGVDIEVKLAIVDEHLDVVVEQGHDLQVFTLGVIINECILYFGITIRVGGLRDIEFGLGYE